MIQTWCFSQSVENRWHSREEFDKNTVQGYEQVGLKLQWGVVSRPCVGRVPSSAWRGGQWGPWSRESLLEMWSPWGGTGLDSTKPTGRSQENQHADLPVSWRASGRKRLESKGQQNGGPYRSAPCDSEQRWRQGQGEEWVTADKGRIGESRGSAWAPFTEILRVDFFTEMTF